MEPPFPRDYAEHDEDLPAAARPELIPFDWLAWLLVAAILAAIALFLWCWST